MAGCLLKRSLSSSTLRTLKMLEADTFAIGQQIPVIEAQSQKAGILLGTLVEKKQCNRSY